MNDLNTFIDDILTVDYGYFWASMEVIDSTPKDIPFGGQYYGPGVTYKMYTTTEAGQEYAAPFKGSITPPLPPNAYRQRALTNLLNLTNEQKKAHIGRLYQLIQIWGDNGDTGVLGAWSRLNDAYRFVQGGDLLTLNADLNGQGITTKNIPTNAHTIRLRDSFYETFSVFVSKKIEAVEQLIYDLEASMPAHMRSVLRPPELEDNRLGGNDGSKLDNVPNDENALVDSDKLGNSIQDLSEVGDDYLTNAQSGTSALTTKDLSTGLWAYIIENRRGFLIRFIKERYANMEVRRHYAFVLVALEETDSLVLDALVGYSDELHQAITDTFGDVGKRQNIGPTIARLRNNKDNRKGKDKIRADGYKREILAEIVKNEPKKST